MTEFYSKMTPLGYMTLFEDNGFLVNVEFAHKEGGRQTPLLAKAFLQLDEYFNKKRQVFELPLAPEGTKFQSKVWDALQKIPYGKTISYKTLAELCGNAKASRAVGGANHRNPLPIFIPCHRVIGANGQLVGYGGGLSIKQFLINLEQER